jgi:hypothetical protein
MIHVAGFRHSIMMLIAAAKGIVAGVALTSASSVCRHLR